MRKEKIELSECYWFQFKNSTVIEDIENYANKKNLRIVCYITGEKAAWGIKTKLIIVAIPLGENVPSKSYTSKTKDFLKGYVKVKFDRIYVVRTTRSVIYADLLGFYKRLVKRYGPV